MSLLARLRQRWRFEWGYARLRGPKVRRGVEYDAATDAELAREIEKTDISFESYRIDAGDYRQFLKRADYARFATYYANGRQSFHEKTLEHYLAARLLDLRAGEVYIDIANCDSPAPEIYAELYGVKSYRQDLIFPPGMEGDRIGGDAAAMPVADGFADAMALHCSFEHFEGDADMRFVREAARVLRPGGRVLIVPLYLFHHHAIQVDPAVLHRGALPCFDAGATLHCARGYGNRHGRFYDIRELQKRVLAHLGPLRARLLHLVNANAIHPDCYMRFALLLEKPKSA